MTTETPTIPPSPRRFPRIWVLLGPVAVAVLSYCAARLAFPSCPRVVVEAVTELGSVHPNTSVDVPIDIRNEGTLPLFVSEFASNCPITVFVKRQPAGEAEPGSEVTVDPGQRTTVLVRVWVVGAVGTLCEPSLRFRTNDPGHPEVSLVLRGTVRGTLSPHPAQLVLGLQDAGALVARRIQLRDTGRGRPFRANRVAVVGCETLHVRLRAVEAKLDTDAFQFGVVVAEIEVKGGIPLEEPNGEVRIEVHEEGSARPIIIPIRYTVRKRQVLSSQHYY